MSKLRPYWLALNKELVRQPPLHSNHSSTISSCPLPKHSDKLSRCLGMIVVRKLPASLCRQHAVKMMRTSEHTTLQRCQDKQMPFYKCSWRAASLNSRTWGPSWTSSDISTQPTCQGVPSRQSQNWRSSTASRQICSSWRNRLCKPVKTTMLASRLVWWNS